MQNKNEKLEVGLEVTLKTIREAYRQASSFLSDQGIQDSLFEVEWMLRELLGVDRASFFLMWDEILTDEQQTKWGTWVKRRGQHEPLQYIFGKANFYDRFFRVTPAVLIPRPETELLVKHVLQDADQFFGNIPLNVVEVGTGSGCIAITLQLERPDWKVTTIDLSEDALDVARQNASLYGVEDQIHFCLGSYLEPVQEEAVQLIIANPPYIPSPVIANLDKEVKAYEPHLALDGGADGLYPYRVLTQQIAALHPVTKRLIAFEIGDEQGEQVAELVKGISGCSRVEVRKDIMDRNRYVFGFFDK
jgi:release factor glutamine methyltransferase